MDASVRRSMPRRFAPHAASMPTSKSMRSARTSNALGVLGDWEHPYLTMMPRYEAEQLRAFAIIIKNGHVYKGYKPVHWCLNCRSALAEAEVEYEDRTSPSIYVRFEVVDRADLAQRFVLAITDQNALIEDVPTSVAIWTTTPWTLPANRAVAVHPQFDYALVEFDLGDGRERLLLANELVKPIMHTLGVSDWTVIAEAKGAALEHLQLQHPLYDRRVPVILGEHVTLDAGTGAVHTAPGHGLDDYVSGAATTWKSKIRWAAMGASCPRRRYSRASKCSMRMRMSSKSLARTAACSRASRIIIRIRIAGGTRRR